MSRSAGMRESDRMTSACPRVMLFAMSCDLNVASQAKSPPRCIAQIGYITSFFEYSKTSCATTATQTTLRACCLPEVDTQKHQARYFIF